MPDKTPARPELPEYGYAYTFMQNAHVVSLKDAIAYGEACRADERRKTLDEAAASFERFFKPSDELDVAYVVGSIRAIDRKEPTT